MLKSRVISLSTAALLAVVAAASSGPLHAQAPTVRKPVQLTPVPRDQVQLAFGYQCDDRFLLRNDGSKNVTVEYGTAGSAARSSLQLAAKEEVELSSPSNEALQLWVEGALVATEPRGSRACAQSQANRVVVVRPMAPPPAAVTYVEPVYAYDPYYYPPRTVVYLGARPYYRYRSPRISVTLPLFSPFGFGHGRVVHVGRGRHR